LNERKGEAGKKEREELQEIKVVMKRGAIKMKAEKTNS
jgi:hypothetical protein